MSATYQRWVRDDGTPMIRVRGVHNVPPTRADGPPHRLTGTPYEYDRQDYPPYQLPARSWGDHPPETSAGAPAALRRATWINPASANLPRGVVTQLERARAAGWHAGLAGAQAADGTHILSLAASCPGRRVLLSWKWRPPRWTPATKARASRWIPEGSWATDTGLIGRRGAAGAIEWTKTTVTEAAKELT